MAVFMSDGLADIISIPKDEIVIEAESIVKLKIREFGDKQVLSAKFKDNAGIAKIIHMVGSSIRINVGDRSVDCKVSQAAFATSSNTISIKGTVLNTY